MGRGSERGNESGGKEYDRDECGLKGETLEYSKHRTEK